jgi:hypothetical protein
VWQTVCRNCRWTSGQRATRDEADAMGKLHEQDNPGHFVEMKEITGGPGKAKKPFGEKM